MAENARTIIIGLDGVPFGMLKGFAETGIMPNTGKIIQGGFFTPMRSSVPEISSVAWSSIITATNPAEHGIFGFVDLHPNSYRMKFPNFSDLKAPPFWHLSPGKSVIINVPATYPVRETNGVHISGFVSIDFEKSVYPGSLVPQLKDMDYRLDVDSRQGHSAKDLFMADLDKTLDARIRAYQYLWENHQWQTFMLVFTGTDRLMHFLWDAYEDKDHKYHDGFIEHFRKIDVAVGQILSELNDNDVLIMLSDHGFEKLEKELYINHLLASEGFLTFAPGAKAELGSIAPATKAFAMDPGRIYINQKGKYPAGSVEAGDKDACIQEIAELFTALEIDGVKAIKYVYRKQDVYSGPYLDDGPDLVLIAEKGFNLKGTMSSDKLTGTGPFTGKHTYADAFLVVNNSNAADGLDNQPSVIDAGRLIKSLVCRS